MGKCGHGLGPHCHICAMGDYFLKEVRRIYKVSARDELQKLADESNVSTKFVMGMFDIIIEAVKEDLGQGPKFDHTWEGTFERIPCPNCMNREPGAYIKTDGLGSEMKCDVCGRSLVEAWVKDQPSKPELIQGYTAEQWQEIINGGYLCEFDEEGDFPCVVIYTLGYIDALKPKPFLLNHSDGQMLAWECCRPAQIKGVMRPIFVEPVDKEVVCHFFDENGNWLDAARWSRRDDIPCNECVTKPAKYIEL